MFVIKLFVHLRDCYYEDSKGFMMCCLRVYLKMSTDKSARVSFVIPVGVHNWWVSKLQKLQKYVKRKGRSLIIMNFWCKNNFLEVWTSFNGVMPLKGRACRLANRQIQILWRCKVHDFGYFQWNWANWMYNFEYNTICFDVCWYIHWYWLYSILWT